MYALWPVGKAGLVRTQRSESLSGMLLGSGRASEQIEGLEVTRRD